VRPSINKITMKNTTKGILIGVLLSLSFTSVIASGNGEPFSLLWDALANLEQKITNIELTPGPQGEKGEKGDKGDVGLQGVEGVPGEDAVNGAGNISFCSVDGGSDCRTVLRNDGSVWEYNGMTWIPKNRIVPVAIENIVIWGNDVFLDTSGDVWKIEGAGYVNIGHPPHAL
jgi:hypothetical protein